MKSAIAVGVLLVFGAACTTSTPQQGVCGSGTADKIVTLSPTNRVEDVNPTTWLAQYSGSHQGTLTWASGGQTTATMTTSAESPLVVSVYCVGGDVVEVTTYGNIMVTSADGGLDYAATTIVGGNLPAYAEADIGPSAISPSGLPPPWKGDLAAHFPVDLSRYGSDASLELTLDWPLSTNEPTGAHLDFVGSPLQAPGSEDRILVATITFP